MYMDVDKGEITGISVMMIMAFIVGFISAVTYNEIRRDTYKHGQIDALNNEIAYELITHENQTKTWELIQNGE